MMFRRALYALAFFACAVPADAATVNLGSPYRDTSTGAIYLRGAPSPYVLGLPAACPANQFAMGSSTSTGLPICVQPSFGNISGTLLATQFPAVSGDCTTTAGSVSITCTKTAGTAFTPAATTPIGTSGATIGLNNANKTDSGNNTTSGNNTHNGSETFAGTTAVPNTSIGDSSTKAANTQSVLAQIGASLSSNSVLGFRNRLINGDMRLDQRNNGASFTASGYGLDRWSYSTAGTAPTSQRVFANGDNVLRTTGPAGGGSTFVALIQPIESLNTYDLAGATVTLQAKLSASTALTIGAQIQSPSAIDNYGGGTGAVAYNCPNWSVTTTPTVFSCTTTLATGTNGAQYGLRVVLGAGSGLAAGVTLDVTNVQLEAGSIATAFERRPVAVELPMAQRYYENGTGYSITYASASGAANQMSPVNLKVQKRIVPTVNLSNITYTNASALTLQNTFNASFLTGITVTSGPGRSAAQFTYEAIAEIN